MSSSNSTPTQKSTSRKQSQTSYNSSLRASARQQDAQARNKDAYEDYSSDSSTGGRSFSRADSYETKQKKREAAIILDSPDLLMMYAQARGDSIPGTRLFYMKQLCGYEDAPKAPVVSKGGSGSGSASREREKAREKKKRDGRPTTTLSTEDFM